MALLIVIGIIVLIVIWVISLYNGLVKLRNRRQNAFADIDVQLRQRHDLVPQLVETVKGYASHERELLLESQKPEQQQWLPEQLMIKLKLNNN